MSVIIVKKQSDAAKIKLGDNYVIDVWPDASEEDQTVTQAMLDQAQKLEDFIQKKLSQ